MMSEALKDGGQKENRRIRELREGRREIEDGGVGMG